MCFDVDSSPPIPAISGGSVTHEALVLAAADGNRFSAFEATTGSEVAVVILPDVRGLYRFYEELALRFAEHGVDAIAIDYFGRTAGVGTRAADWDYMPEVKATTIDGVTMDVATAIDHMRRGDPGRKVFVVGFCFGGSNAWHMAASDLGIAGAIGFYGNPSRPDVPTGAPSVMARVPKFSCPILALQAGEDLGIPVDVDDRFAALMKAEGKDGEVVIYEHAPHSFFDRKQDEFEEESADAWRRVLAFIAAHG